MSVKKNSEIMCVHIVSATAILGIPQKAYYMKFDISISKAFLKLEGGIYFTILFYGKSSKIFFTLNITISVHDSQEKSLHDTNFGDLSLSGLFVTGWKAAE